MKILSAGALIVKAAFGGMADALLWVLRGVLTEKLFRGLALDVARWGLRWLARAIPGTADDVIINRAIRAVDTLEKNWRATGQAPGG